MSVTKVTELIDICRTVATTGLMGHRLTPEHARCVLGLVQAMRDAKREAQEMLVVVAGMISMPALDAQVAAKEWLEDVPPEVLEEARRSVGMRQERSKKGDVS